MKIYSVVINWNDNDVAEQGDFGVMVHAANADEAEQDPGGLIAWQ